MRAPPHQLRGTCTTLLLDEGVPAPSVWTILRHKHIDTTLAYARLYDSTVAKDYYLAMDTIESCLDLGEEAEERPPTGGQLLALVDSLQGGTLSMDIRETAHGLRTGILAFVTQQTEVI